MTISASKGFNFNNLHSHKALNGAAAFCLQIKQNGLLDPGHQIIKAFGLCMTTRKLWNRGKVIIIFVLSDRDAETHTELFMQNNQMNVLVNKAGTSRLRIAYHRSAS